jgi:hypothetical protein
MILLETSNMHKQQSFAAQLTSDRTRKHNAYVISCLEIEKEAISEPFISSSSRIVNQICKVIHKVLVVLNDSVLTT